MEADCNAIDFNPKFSLADKTLLAPVPPSEILINPMLELTQSLPFHLRIDYSEQKKLQHQINQIFLNSKFLFGWLMIHHKE